MSEKYVPPPGPFSDWTIDELRKFLDTKSVDYSECIDYSDYVKLAVQVSDGKDRPADLQPSTGNDSDNKSNAPKEESPSSSSTAEPPPKKEEEKGKEKGEEKGEEKDEGKDGRKLPDLYAVLDVPRDATKSQITRAYYNLAKKYHPDKNPGDAVAEERFKLISEAYQILTDPEKREYYDKYGTVKEEDDGDDELMFFVEVIRSLFGAGSFCDYFYTPFINPDSRDDFEDIFSDDPERVKKKNEEAAKDSEILSSLNIVDEDDEALEIKPDDDGATKEKKRLLTRIHRMARKYLKKLVKIVRSGALRDKKKRGPLFAEAAELADAPGGPELLSLLGYILAQEGSINDKSFLSAPTWISEIKRERHIDKSKRSLDDNELVYEYMANKSEYPVEILVEQKLRVLWVRGFYFLELEVRAAIGFMFYDMGIPKAVKNDLAKALKLLGETFKEVGDRITDQLEKASKALSKEYKKQDEKEAVRKYYGLPEGDEKYDCGVAGANPGTGADAEKGASKKSLSFDLPPPSNPPPRPPSSSDQEQSDPTSQTSEIGGLD